MQSRLLSLIEILISTFLGFLIGVFSNILVLPLFGLHASISDSIWISVIFTLIGIARSYLIRRLFNKFNPMLNKYFKEKKMKKNIEQIKPLTDREVSLSLKYFVENILQLKQTMLYLGLDVEDVEIKLGKTDWQYILRETKYDRNGKAIKFLKESDIDGRSFELCGIKVSYE